MTSTNRNKYYDIPFFESSDIGDDSFIPQSILFISIFEDLLRNNTKLDATALDSLNSKLSELTIKNQINTLICHEMSKVLFHNRQLFAENIILKRRLREIERIVCEKKKRKNDKRNVLKSKMMISISKVLEKLKKCEAKANLKKTKWGYRRTRNQAKAIQEVESTSEEDEEDEETEVFEVIEVARFRRGCK